VCPIEMEQNTSDSYELWNSPARLIYFSSILGGGRKMEKQEKLPNRNMGCTNSHLRYRELQTSFNFWGNVITW